MSSSKDDIKRPVGRPRLDEKMEYLRVRVPEKLLVIADGLDLPYKKLVRENFEKMVCVAILTKRGETNCEICENVITRNQIIEEEYQQALAAFKKEQAEKVEEEQKMSKAIKQAVLDGMTRGEAESEYGRVFPDHVWKKYGGKS